MSCFAWFRVPTLLGASDWCRPYSRRKTCRASLGIGHGASVGPRAPTGCFENPKTRTLAEKVQHPLDAQQKVFLSAVPVNKGVVNRYAGLAVVFEIKYVLRSVCAGSHPVDENVHCVVCTSWMWVWDRIMPRICCYALLYREYKQCVYEPFFRDAPCAQPGVMNCISSANSIFWPKVLFKHEEESSDAFTFSSHGHTRRRRTGQHLLSTTT